MMIFLPLSVAFIWTSLSVFILLELIFLYRISFRRRYFLNILFLNYFLKFYTGMLAKHLFCGRTFHHITLAVLHIKTIFFEEIINLMSIFWVYRIFSICQSLRFEENFIEFPFTHLKSISFLFWIFLFVLPIICPHQIYDFQQGFGLVLLIFLLIRLVLIHLVQLLVQDHCFSCSLSVVDRIQYFQNLSV